jgi:UDP-N-acetylglucosamine:LPS N-acetylglucosamine transferase
MEKYHSFILTEKTAYSIANKDRVYYVQQVNRREKMIAPKLIANSFAALLIFIKERPDVIICTGALAMVPMCLLMKFFHRRLIFIESFAKITSPTKTGKLLYRFADQFYVQWESMLTVYPNAIFVGGIY